MDIKAYETKQREIGNHGFEAAEPKPEEETTDGPTRPIMVNTASGADEAEQKAALVRRL